jgi:hypothetical protein
MFLLFGRSPDPDFSGDTPDPDFSGDTPDPDFSGDTPDPDFSGDTPDPGCCLSFECCITQVSICSGEPEVGPVPSLVVEARLALAAVVIVVAVVVARLLERRRSDPPARDAYPIPAQLDRSDFPRPDAPWIVVLFSSGTCDSCVPMAVKVAALESDTVATCDVEAAGERELHRRYRIEGVPMVVVADADGIVRAGFVGTVSASDLAGALTDAGGGG